MPLISVQQDFVVKNGAVVKGNAIVTSSTNQSGALQANGGAAVAANLIVGSTASFYGSNYIYNGIFQPSFTTGGVLFTDPNGQYIQDAGLNYNTSTSVFSATNISSNVITVNTNLLVPSTVGTYSSQTGAVQVTGGVGIQGGLFVGGNFTATNIYGNIYATNSGTFQVGFATTAGFLLNTSTTMVGWATTATNLYNTATTRVGFANTASSLAYTATTMVGWATTATNLYNTSTTQVGYATTAGFAVTFNTNTLVTTAVTLLNTSTTQVGYATTAGFAVTFNTNTLVTTSVNLVGGAKGSLPYQTSASNTAMLPIGSEGYILTVNSSLPAWEPLAGVTAGNSTTATNLAGGVYGSIPYQYAPGITSFINPSPVVGAVFVSNGPASSSSYITSVTAQNSGTTSFNQATGQSLVVRDGGLGVTGDSYFANNLGIGGNLWVYGNATFAADVTFNGTATYVYSTNTYYTDNILELHTPPGGVNGTWAFDDGKDIGLRFHYFNVQQTADANAFLGLADDTQYLEWYNTGYESTSGVFSSATYGTFKTGEIILVGTDPVNNTTTGALQVAGGVGIGGGLVVGGTITATNIYAAIYATNSQTLAVGFATTAGFALSFNTSTLVQRAVNIINTATTMVGWATTATNLYSTGTTNVAYATTAGFAVTFNTNTLVTSATYITNTATTMVGWATTATNLYSTGTTNVAYATTAGFAVTFNTATLVTTSVNLLGGAPGSIPYQLTTNTTAMLGIGTSTYILSALNGFPAWIPSNGLQISAANTASNLAGGQTNQIPYQLAPGVTTFSNGLTFDGTTFTATNLYVTNTATIGADLNVYGNIYMKGVGLDTISGTTGTFVNLIVTGTAATIGGLNSGSVWVAGGVNITKDVYASTATFNTLNVTSTLDTGYVGGSTATNSWYSIASQGGLKVAKSIVAGGVISAGDYGGTGTRDPLGFDSGSRDGFFLLNNMQSARTIQSVVGTAPVTIDNWDKTLYTSAKYIVQLKDGSNVFVAELMVLNDGGSVFISQYGIIYNNYSLGTFDGVISGNYVFVTFTPTGAVNMTVQVVRQSVMTNPETYILS